MLLPSAGSGHFARRIRGSGEPFDCAHDASNGAEQRRSTKSNQSLKDGRKDERGGHFPFYSEVISKESVPVKEGA